MPEPLEEPAEHQAAGMDEAGWSNSASADHDDDHPQVAPTVDVDPGWSNRDVKQVAKAGPQPEEEPKKEAVKKTARKRG